MPANPQIIALLTVLLFIVILAFTIRLYTYFTRRISKQERKNMQSVLETQESERRAIAKEVHDNLCPLLSITNMQVEASMRNITDAETLELMSEVQKQLKHAISICRDISHELTPSLHERTTLQDMISDYVAKIQNARKIEIAFRHALEQVVIHHKKASSICRIVLEMMNNTIKHAQAKQISIEMTEKDSFFHLAYSDDGIGIGNTSLTSGIGLKNIVSRVQTLNGQVNIGTPSCGCEIRIRIPVEELT